MSFINSVSYKIFKLKNKKIGKDIYQDIVNRAPVYGLRNDYNNNEQVVVSMTTFSKRYSTIIPSLKSLLNQTYKPNHIIVWLDDDIPENKITSEMEKFKDYGIEFRNTTYHLKPHTKYFYAMQEYNEANIITVDDDLVYSPDLIESLMKMHSVYPDCVCARRVHKIKLDANGNIVPYKNWIYECRSIIKPSYMLCATGCGGVLYPPHIMPEETFNVEAIRENCLCADDIWLKVMQLIAGIKVVWVPSNYIMPYEVQGSQEVALNIINTNGDRNDEYINILKEKYPIIQERLVDEYKSIKNR